MKSKTVTSNEVRIPAPVRGTATHVTRYGRDQSVILHPDDYRTLEAFDELVERACRLPPLEVSEAGYTAHIDEDRSRGEPIEDPVALRKLLG